jgi:hypothetical protein
MWGYGGEKVMGTTTQEIWDYCMEHQVDLSDIAWDSDAAEDLDLDPDMLPFYPGSWYECDGMAHASGVSRDSGTLQIEDEDGNTVFEKELGDCDGGDDSPEWSCFDEAWIGSQPAGTVVFVGSSNEKGTFFEGEINLTAPFDITKLTLSYEEIDGEELVSSVTYDGEDIDNFGGSTDGKSSDFGMYVVIDSNTWETYDPEEKDWGTPECGTGPDDWEKSPEFKFKKVKPVHAGWYRCVWNNFGRSYGSLYWDGKEFGDFFRGKFKPESDVVSWQGYNWDTTSWSNQPPAPPEALCKKCSWVGSREAMPDDDEHNYTCPDCGATLDDINWLDYDPDTKQGRANRKRYCKPWDPAVALDRIAVPEVEEDRTGETVALKGSWPF